jgi:formylglycine-generating enzyme required for sulfatase activity
MAMIYVPAGEFIMGSSIGENEGPEHKVYVDAFWIDQTEVTNAMFRKFVDATSYRTNAEMDGWASVFNSSAKEWQDITGASWQHPRGPSNDLSGLDNYPVVQISWNDAKAYCEWVGRRLPTEAEWEKAARGTDSRIYPWGNQNVTGDLLNLADQNLNVQWAKKDVDDGYQFAAPVGHYPDGASPYGVYDMMGNVQEWVADFYDENYYATSPIRNPTGPMTGQGHILRGGGWNDGKSSVRVTYRKIDSSEARSDNTGFRCAQSAQ